MKLHNIQLYAIGIDDKEWFSNEAFARLDESIYADATTLREYNGIADIVSCIHVNTEDHRLFIQNISRFLKPDGFMVVSIPIPSMFYRFEWLQVKMPHMIYERMMPTKNRFVLLTKTEIEKNNW